MQDEKVSSNIDEDDLETSFSDLGADKTVPPATFIEMFAQLESCDQTKHHLPQIVEFCENISLETRGGFPRVFDLIDAVKVFSRILPKQFEKFSNILAAMFDVDLFDDVFEIGELLIKQSSYYSLRFKLTKQMLTIYRQLQQLKKENRSLKNEITRSYFDIKNVLLNDALLTILERQLSYVDYIQHLESENHDLSKKLSYFTAQDWEQESTKKNVRISELENKVSELKNKIILLEKKQPRSLNSNSRGTRNTFGGAAKKMFFRPKHKVPTRSHPPLVNVRNLKTTSSSEDSSSEQDKVKKNVLMIKSSIICKIMTFVSDPSVFLAMCKVSKIVFDTIMKYYNCLRFVAFRLRKHIPIESKQCVADLCVARHYSFTDDDLKFFPNVRRLRMQKVNKFLGKGLKYNQSNLVDLTLSHCTNVKDEMFQYCEDLEKLRLVWCPNINGSGFKYLLQLKEINIDWSIKIGDPAFSMLNDLEKIVMQKCCNVTGLTFLKLANLREVRILNCVKFMQPLISEFLKKGVKVFYK